MNPHRADLRMITAGRWRVRLASWPPKPCLRAALRLCCMQGRTDAGPIAAHDPGARGAVAAATCGEADLGMQAAVTASSAETFHATALAAFTALRQH